VMTSYYRWRRWRVWGFVSGPATYPPVFLY